MQRIFFTLCIFGQRVITLIKHHLHVNDTFFLSFVEYDREEGEDALEAAKSGSVEALQKTLSANPELVNIKDDMASLFLSFHLQGYYLYLVYNASVA